MYLEWPLNIYQHVTWCVFSPGSTQSMEVCWVSGEEEDPIPLVRAVASENCHACLMEPCN